VEVEVSKRFVSRRYEWRRKKEGEEWDGLCHENRKVRFTTSRSICKAIAADEAFFWILGATLLKNRNTQQLCRSFYLSYSIRLDIEMVACATFHESLIKRCWCKRKKTCFDYEVPWFLPC